MVVIDDDMCLEKLISIEELILKAKREVSNDSIIESYKVLGCYACDGFNKDCPLYKPIIEVFKRYNEEF